jgi:polysaccharide pyruvyl transferase CsaB
VSRFLFLGYFGFGNLGDEALLEAMVLGLRQRVPDAEITAVTADPETTRTDLDIGVVPRSPTRGVLRAIRACDTFVLGPGGLLQDTTSVRSVVYYCVLARLAVRWGKELYLVGHGVGPLRSRIGRWATKGVAQRARGITVRDAESLQTLRSLSPSIEATLAADVALLLEPDSGAGDRLLEEAGLADDDNVVGVSLRPWGADRHLPQLTEALGRVRRELGCRFLFLPFGGDGDRRLLMELGRLLNEGDPVAPLPLRPRTVLGLCGRLRGLVGMRLHSLVLAGLAGIPIAGIAYDPKIGAFLAEIGAEPVADLTAETMDVGLISERILAVLGQGQPEAQSRRIGELRGRAALNVELLTGGS